MLYPLAGIGLKHYSTVTEELASSKKVETVQVFDFHSGQLKTVPKRRPTPPTGNFMARIAGHIHKIMESNENIDNGYLSMRHYHRKILSTRVYIAMLDIIFEWGAEILIAIIISFNRLASYQHLFA